MSGIYYNGSSGGGGGGSVTIDGDVSSASGSTITLTGGTSGAVFTGDGASTITESFNFLALPATADDGTSGYISMGGIVAFHAIGTYNAFGGLNAATNGFTGVPSGAGSSYNASFGAYSLFNNTTGYANTANGYQSLYANTTGYQNTVHGMYAGRYVADGITGRTTGNNGLYLGYNSKASADGTDNEIVIGYNAIGAGTNKTVIGNSSTTDTYFGSSTGASKIWGSAINVSGLIPSALIILGYIDVRS